MTNIKRVLVVEDEVLIALQLKAALEAVGYSVVGPVASLEAAYAAGAEEDFDAAVLDVNLGGKSVFPFAEQMVQEHVPTVLLTGYDLPELPPGAAHIPVLRKPLDVHVLDIILRRLGRQAPRPTEPARAAGV